MSGADVTIDDTVMYENMARDEGGALCVTRGTLRMSHVNMWQNSLDNSRWGLEPNLRATKVMDARLLIPTSYCPLFPASVYSS